MLPNREATDVLVFFMQSITCCCKIFGEEAAIRKLLIFKLIALRKNLKKTRGFLQFAIKKLTIINFFGLRVNR